MSIQSLSAANAYLAAAKAARAAAEAPQQTDKSGDAQFSKLVDQAVKSVVETGQNVEKTAALHAQGKADLVDVVTAVAETEVTMRALVSVRDRVINAYQEVLRMPI